jgi:hypothetical protein
VQPSFVPDHQFHGSNPVPVTVGTGTRPQPVIRSATESRAALMIPPPTQR